MTVPVLERFATPRLSTRIGSISVVVPTRNESGNIGALVDGLIGALQHRLAEVVFVDDSSDDTPAVIHRLAADCPVPIVLIHRLPEARAGGLASAVVAGIERASEEWVCVMDGDLQHPPQVIPSMLREAELGHYDLVAAGRFAEHTITDMSLARRSLSRFLNATLRRILAPVRKLRDPLTGFFLMRSSAINVAGLEPVGFKILVELLARNPEMHVGEVGFDFGKRHSGTSKASPRTMVDLVRHVFRLRRSMGNRELHHYDIHGVITVTSPVVLPELRRFEVPDLARQATITLRVGSTTAASAGDLSFGELGRMGFGMRMRRSPSIVIHVSRLVAKSPHVLYTNVVEPVLRWEFVRRGYALVHAACIARDGEAFLVTARTDTGKTTTMLKLLDNGGLGFVSDDLILVDRSGTVLTYPKPLTISSHTVAAVRQAELRRGERLALKIQSRLHSRSGRRVAFTLTKSRLPVATINAIAQFVIPPPKYDITRLIPGVEMVEKARIAGMFIIERGAPGARHIEPTEALEILLANCEDAFGFPPYRQIESYLHSANGAELRAEERSIISEALLTTSTEILSSDSLDWAETIAARLADSAVAE